jgi:hypothetical protein
MRCLGRATSNFTAASHRHAVTQAVGKHVRRGAQQLSPFVGCHEQQGTGGDMLHVAVREFAGGGESLLLVLPENGSGCAKASMSERSRGWMEVRRSSYCMYMYCMLMQAAKNDSIDNTRYRSSSYYYR